MRLLSPAYEIQIMYSRNGFHIRSKLPPLIPLASIRNADLAYDFTVTPIYAQLHLPAMVTA